MWHNTRRGRNLIRKRYSTRKFRLNLVNICIVIACIFVVGVSGLGIYNILENRSLNNPSLGIIESDLSINDNHVVSQDKVQIYDEKEEIESNKKTFSLAFLGELMMGGDIGQNLNYNYMSAFKNIAQYTSKAHYTSINLATNIVDLEELRETKSKYIVTNKIENAFNALGVDGINIANDHMMDFDEEVFKDTITSLQDYDVIGLKDTIVYAEHDGIKVAIIGVCNEVIGTESKYTNAGIMMYNMPKIKDMIKEAKQNVNTVILLTHLGLENTNKVTNVMSWFYRELINAGADIVLGTHALGLYPIEIYKGKPIIYSMGNLMSDTDYLQGKETGIFTVNVNEGGIIESLEILPLYINAKRQTMLYSEYNNKNSIKLLDTLTENLSKQEFEILEDKVKLYLNK